MPDAPPIVVLGRVTGAFGVMGWVKVEPYTESSDALTEFGDWWVRSRESQAGGAGRQSAGEGEWHSVHVTAARVHGGSVVAQLAGIDDRDAALGLRGSEIGVPREALPATNEDEIYWTDLVGLQVVNREGQALGRVREVVEHGAHPLLQVVSESGTARLIPYVPAIVEAVDIEAKRIDVDWGEDY